MAEKEQTAEEKLLKVIQKGEGAVAETFEGDPSSSVSPPVPVTAVVSGRAVSSVSVVTRVLVAAALILVLLGVYETYSSIPGAAPVYAARAFDTVVVQDYPEGLGLSDAVDMFARRRIFGPPPPAAEEGPVDAVPQARGWRAYVRDHMDLKGTSAYDDGTGGAALEAIMMDNKVQRMQFLREGETVRIADRDVEVVRIGSNQVELRHGEEVLVVD